MTRKKILVVDDNPIILKALASKLKAAGFDALTAEDGAEAIRTVRNNPPDLIIMDVGFPPDVSHGGGVPWDGFQLMGWLRRFGDASAIPFIVITGTDPVESKRRARAAGAVGFFQKPLDHAALIDLLRQTLDPKVT